jgi:predicted nucleic acid-binding protein
LSKRKGIPRWHPQELIIDCSIVMAWFFVDERDAYADMVAGRLPGSVAFVPSNWALEVANSLLMGERRKRCTPTQAAGLIKALKSIPITVDDETNLHAWEATLDLARRYDLTAYDAAYLELAMRRGLPLASLDDKLNAAAKAAGVPHYAPP